MRNSWHRIALIVLAAGVFIACLPWFMILLGNSLYSNGNFTSAGGVWHAASYISFYDRDVALYDTGNAYYQRNQYDQAATSYEAASKVATDRNRCAIVYNWSLALTARGDDLASSDKATALSYYSNALRAIAVQQCVDSKTYKEPFNQQYQDLLKKIAALSKQQSSNSSSGSKSDAKQSSGDTSSGEQIVQNNSGELQQQQQYQLNQGYDQQTATDPSFSNITFVQ